MTRMRWMLPVTTLLMCCGQGPPVAAAFTYAIHARGELKQDLAAVDIERGGRPLGATDARGIAKINLEGLEGELIELSARCPGGMRATEPEIQFALRSAPPAEPMEYDVTCVPLQREVVIAVRTQNAPSLPILYFGREIARTQDGVAHVLIDALPSQPIELVLGTTSAEALDLRPQNPSASFLLKDRDEVLTFDQSFSREIAKRVVRRPRERSAPTAIRGLRGR